MTSRWAISCAIIMTIQQMMEASYTYWLVLLTEEITTGQPFFTTLLCFLASLLVPYIPSCLALITRTSWKQHAQRHFVESFVAANRNNIGEWSNKAVKEEKLSILTSEGPNTISNFIDYSWDLYTYVISVLFNILALSIVVEPLFVVSYVVSVVLALIIMQMRRRTQRQLTQKALMARVDLCQSLLGAWDNVLLGNAYNFKLWNERTSQRLKRCLQRNVDLERFDQVLAVIAALITSIPSFIVVIYVMWKNQHDVVLLTSYVVILPLLFMILSYTYQTLSLMFRWSMHRNKLVTVCRAIYPAVVPPLAMEKKIKWPKIIASHQTEAPSDHVSLAAPRAMASHTDLLSQTDRSGRLTLRGENGSGKSTALMLIKSALANRAFFLPTHNQLSFVSETHRHSTGESLRNRLMEILDKVDADVLLLDEWDANLDPENQEKLSILIDQLSKTKCVIEVRHR